MTQDSLIRLEGRVVSPPDVPACVRTYFEALNAEDWPRFAEVWADTAELQAVGSRARHGRQDIMSYFLPLFEPWARHVDRPTRFIVAGDTVVVEIVFTGLTPAGKELNFAALDVFDLSEGVIARLVTWYDLSWVRKQL